MFALLFWRHVIDTVWRHDVDTDTNISSTPNKNKADTRNAISLPFLGAKLCLHQFLHLENSLVNLFFRLEQTQKSKK